MVLTRDVCDGNPCQNNGTCTSLTKDDVKVGFTEKTRSFVPIKVKFLKLYKISECSCVDGFTGNFCEFKKGQKHLLFITERHQYAFGTDGILIGKSEIIDKQAGAYFSCSTIIDGEAFIFGGDGDDLSKQVK